jgi:hypothetical protein
VEEFNDIISMLATIGGLIGLVGGPWVFIVGRRYFAEAKNTVSPLQMVEKLEINKHSIINEVNAIVGRADLEAGRRHDQLLANLADVRDGMKEAIRKAGEAVDQSSKARTSFTRIVRRCLLGSRKR